MDRKVMILKMIRRMHMPAEVCVSRNSVNRLATLSASRILVISSSSSKENGVLNKIKECFSKAGTTIQVWTSPSQEPTIVTITQIASFAMDLKPDWIVAIGGGTILDLAKFVWSIYEHPTLEIGARNSVEVPPLRKKARYIAIPTTAGSGSEASQVAVLTNHETNRKQPYVSPEWVPDIVILDPTLTVSLPPTLTAQTGMDALSHAVESYVSRISNPLVQSLSSTSIRLIFQWLSRVCRNPDDLEARESMLNAAYLAGLCQSTASTGLAHSLAHAVSTVLQISHGQGTAFFLKSTMIYNEAKNSKLYEQLSLDVGLSNFEELSAAIERLACELELRRHLSELIGYTPSDKNLLDIAHIAIEDICTRTNPCPSVEADLVKILDEVK